MPKVTILDVPGLEGEYLIHFEDGFTNRELHLIKQLSGIRAGEIGEAFAANDNDLIVALSMIAMQRNGKDVPVDALWDAKVGSIKWEQTPEEIQEAEGDDALPPASPLASDDASVLVESETPNEPTGSSGPSTNGASDVSPEILPLATGSPPSATSATSDPETSQI
jgi:hypothetical protein